MEKKIGGNGVATEVRQLFAPAQSQASPLAIQPRFQARLLLTINNKTRVSIYLTLKQNFYSIPKLHPS